MAEVVLARGQEVRVDGLGHEIDVPSPDRQRRQYTLRFCTLDSIPIPIPIPPRYVSALSCEGGEAGSYQGDVRVQRPIVQEPVRERPLGAHHVWVLLRAHALPIFLGQRRAVAALARLAARRALAVGRGAVFVRLRYHRYGLLCFLSAAELLREGPGARRGGGGGMAEEC